MQPPERKFYCAAKPIKAELSSPAAVIDIANAGSWVRKWPSTPREMLLLLAATLVSVSLLHGQSAAPAGQPPLPRAIYSPKPVYRPEWAK